MSDKLTLDEVEAFIRMGIVGKSVAVGKPVVCAVCGESTFNKRVHFRLGWITCLDCTDRMVVKGVRDNG
jgi:formylmethanofuran dehydrogenase subunit E